MLIRKLFLCIGSLVAAFLLGQHLGWNPSLVTAFIVFIVFLASFRPMLVLGLFAFVVRWEIKTVSFLKNQVESGSTIGSGEVSPDRMTVYSVRMPKGSQWQPQNATALIRELASVGKIALQIVGNGGQVDWRILDLNHLSHDSNHIPQIVKKVYPEADVTPVSEQATLLLPFQRLSLFFKQTEDFPKPIRYANEITKADPLVHVANAMSQLEPEERMSYLIYLVPTDQRVIMSQARQLTTTSNVTARDATGLAVIFDENAIAALIGAVLTVFLLFGKAIFGKRPAKYNDSDMKLLYHKLSDQPLVRAFIILEVSSPYKNRVQSFNLQPTLQGFATDYQAIDVFPSATRLETIKNLDKVPITDGLARLPKSISPQDECVNVFSPSELASLWHLPHQEMSAASITWSTSKIVPLPRHLTGISEGVCLGDNLSRGRAEPVRLPYASRTTPMMIVGKSGVGKSNLMHQMIHQDLQEGKSVVVVDPHGTLIQDILRRSFPAHREKDLVILDLADTAYPPPLNSLMGLAGDVAVSRVVDVLNKLYPDLKELPLVSDGLENALLTLEGYPDATLWDVDRLFSDAAFRNSLVEQSNDPVLKRFWQDEYDGSSSAQQLQMSAPITRRLRRFYRNVTLRTMICHPKGIDFGQLIREGKVVLISLKAQENTIPELEQRLIGALIISRLQMAAMNGAFGQTPCYCYIDELQNFVTTSIDKVFSEARKFGLSITMANQYLQQLKGDALQAAMGNVGTLAVFQVGQEDAKALVHYTRPGFEVDDLTSLDKYNAALWMRYQDKNEAAFSLKTREPIALSDNAAAREAYLREESRKHNSPLSKAEVLHWLQEREKLSRKPKEKAGEDNADFYDTDDPNKDE